MGASPVFNPYVCFLATQKLSLVTSPSSMMYIMILL
jgi:hypothetical protein